MSTQSLRINLLPHREILRETSLRDFGIRVALCCLLGVAVVVLGAQIIDQYISAQENRNGFLNNEVKKLDAEIVQIATLQLEIEALKSRQKAVEDLQSDRNLPVYLFDELVRYTPEGVYLKSVKQDGLKITLNGGAQSQERVSEFLRNLSVSSAWLEKPELQEIKLLPANPNSKTLERVYDFNVSANLKRERKILTPSAGTSVSIRPGSAVGTAANSAANGANTSPNPASTTGVPAKTLLR